MSTFMKMVRMSTGMGSLGIIAYYTFEKYSTPVNALDPITIPNTRQKTKWDYDWDCRHILEGESKDKKRRLPKRNLILIRHGQYETKAPTEADMKLTPLGREQAKMTGRRLKELNLPYNRLVHSTMTRARETANIIHSYIPTVPMVECSLLEEGSPIEPEPPSRQWRAPHQYHQDGARIEAAFRKYFYRANPSQEEDTYDIIVCHANVIRYFVCRVLQLPPEAWLRLSLKHASITSVTISTGGRVSLRGFGDAGYMPPTALSS